MNVGRTALALAGSLALHLVAGAALLPLLAPRPMPQQSPDQSRILLATMEVPRTRATPRTPEAPEATSAGTAGARMAGQRVPLRRATALVPRRTALQGSSAQGAQRPAMALDEARLDAASEDATQVRGTEVPAQRQPAEAVLAERAGALPATGLLNPTIPPPSTKLSPAQPSPPNAEALAPELIPARVQTVSGDAIAPADSVGTRLQAGLAWSGAGSVALDAQSLSTLQAFLKPGASAGRGVRDRMARVLAAPDCARVHTVFDVQTGTLELRGHVPEEDARAPLLDSLRAQIGRALEVRDRLQILPLPQCALLDGIAALGLPQSEEQLTDSDLVGEIGQVRDYAFTEGDRLVIDLTAPDYPAYVYLDYFDATGQVLHLMPNPQTPLRRLDPGRAFSVGREGDLDLRIAPPFGQDVAVAFATSRPLYNGLRPMVEKAEPYLADLQRRIAEARAAEPGFRGEWVYLFVSTTAAPR